MNNPKLIDHFKKNEDVKFELPSPPKSSSSLMISIALILGIITIISISLVIIFHEPKPMTTPMKLFVSVGIPFCIFQYLLYFVAREEGESYINFLKNMSKGRRGYDFSGIVFLIEMVYLIVGGFLLCCLSAAIYYEL